MVNPCCCCSVATGARILAFVSIVVAVILVGTSSWVLKDTYEERDTAQYKLAAGIGGGIDTIGSIFGAEKKLNVETRSNILLACSGVGVAVGGLQLLSSFFLMIGAAGKSRSPSAIFSFVNSVGFFAIIGSLVCLFYKQVVDVENLDKEADRIKYWVLAMAGDVVFLIYANCAACCFVRS